MIRVPNHSTFSKNRHGRFRDCDVVRHVFERGRARVHHRRSSRRRSLAVDASLANKGGSISGAELNKERDPATASRAV